MCSRLFYLFCYYFCVPGVGIGIVDLGYERRLANQLGAHRAPSIIGLVNGRVTFFHQAVVREHLRQFMEDLLPHTLVEKVTAGASSCEAWKQEAQWHRCTQTNH